MKEGKKIGLSLSGGGYRAAAYHLGTLRKLNEMGILDEIDVISSISGGSITGACYALKGDNFTEFEKTLRIGVKSSIIGGIIRSPRFLLIAGCLLLLSAGMIALLFTHYGWISFILLIITLTIFIKNQFTILPVSKIIEELYNKFYFKGKVLSDMIETPVFAIGATNVETGRLFTFSNDRMGDSSYTHPNNPAEKPITFKSHRFPVARAVAASAANPSVFTPVSIDKKFFTHKEDAKRVTPKLVDGGVYDNQGIHKITQEGSYYECDIVITSDAGHVLQYKNNFINSIQLLSRTSEIFMYRIKKLQLIRNVYENTKSVKREIAYFSLGWDLDKCIPGFISGLQKEIILDTVIAAHGITREEIENKQWETITAKLKSNIGYDKIMAQSPTHEEIALARSVKTNLTALKEKEIDALVKHASSITELQVKLYCPSLVGLS
jgi:NTE family protein